MRTQHGKIIEKDIDSAVRSGTIRMTFYDENRRVPLMVSGMMDFRFNPRY
jgi:hypothetical protein